MPVPVDVLDREVGLAFGGDAAVEQAGDVRVVEPGQDLPLGEEAPVDLVRVHPALDELEGDPLLELAVGALGEIDHAHPAPCQLAHETIGADPASVRGARFRCIGQRPRAPQGVEFQESPGRGIGPQERLDLLAQWNIPGAGLVEPASALGQRADSSAWSKSRSASSQR